MRWDGKVVWAADGIFLSVSFGLVVFTILFVEYNDYSRKYLAQSL